MTTKMIKSFVCSPCVYSTIVKCNFDRHCSSDKHCKKIAFDANIIAENMKEEQAKLVIEQAIQVEIESTRLMQVEADRIAQSQLDEIDLKRSFVELQKSNSILIYENATLKTMNETLRVELEHVKEISFLQIENATLRAFNNSSRNEDQYKKVKIETESQPLKRERDDFAAAQEETQNKKIKNEGIEPVETYKQKLERERVQHLIKSEIKKMEEKKGMDLFSYMNGPCRVADDDPNMTQEHRNLRSEKMIIAMTQICDVEQEEMSRLFKKGPEFFGELGLYMYSENTIEYMTGNEYKKLRKYIPQSYTDFRKKIVENQTAKLPVFSYDSYAPQHSKKEDVTRKTRRFVDAHHNGEKYQRDRDTNEIFDVTGNTLMGHYNTQGAYNSIILFVQTTEKEPSPIVDRMCADTNILYSMNVHTKEIFKHGTDIKVGMSDYGDIVLDDQKANNSLF